MKEIKDIKWGTPASLACLGVFLAGLGIFFDAIWSNFIK
jgi:hypothetical protein